MDYLDMIEAYGTPPKNDKFKFKNDKFQIMKTTIDQVVETLEVLYVKNENFISTSNVRNILEKPTSFQQTYFNITNQLIDLHFSSNNCFGINPNLEFHHAKDMVDLNNVHKIRFSIDKESIKEKHLVQKDHLSNVIVYDLVQLYPSLFVKAFKNKTILLNQQNFDQLYIFLFENRKEIKKLSQRAYYLTRWILNAFYGVLYTKNPNEKYCFKLSKHSEDVIDKFFKHFHYEVEEPLLLATDKIVISSKKTKELQIFLENDFFKSYGISFEKHIYKKKDFEMVKILLGYVRSSLKLSKMYDKEHYQSLTKSLEHYI